MQATNVMAQGSTSLGQVFAAIGIILALAITVPVLGILMVPGALIAGWMRAHLPGSSPIRRAAIVRPV